LIVGSIKPNEYSLTFELKSNDKTAESLRDTNYDEMNLDTVSY
jgi:hypothetical protein